MLRSICYWISYAGLFALWLDPMNHRQSKSSQSFSSRNFSLRGREERSIMQDGESNVIIIHSIICNIMLYICNITLY